MSRAEIANGTMPPLPSQHAEPTGGRDDQPDRSPVATQQEPHEQQCGPARPQQRDPPRRRDQAAHRPAVLGAFADGVNPLGARAREVVESLAADFLANPLVEQWSIEALR